jgi:hypothetical protein
MQVPTRCRDPPTFQRNQRGKTEGGVTTYRWNLEQFLAFIRKREGRPAQVEWLHTGGGEF